MIYSSFHGFIWNQHNDQLCRGHGFKSCTGLNFFQALFHYHASRVYYCEDHVHIHFFICSSHDFRIFTFIYLSLPKFTCDQHNDRLPIGSDSVGRVAVVLQRSWVQILDRPELFSGLIFTTAQVVFITAEITFVFKGLFVFIHRNFALQ